MSSFKLITTKEVKADLAAKDDRPKAVITIAKVKKFNKGGAWVSVPSNLIGREVWIIPKGKFKDATITVSFATTEFMSVKNEGAKKK